MAFASSPAIGMPTFPGNAPPRLEPMASLERDGYTAYRLQSGFHVGTHVDAPIHMIPGGKYIDDFAPEAFSGPGKLLDARGRASIGTEILAGEATYCIGMSEPHAGSDLAGVRTRAVRSGSGFVVTGHKVWTSLAHHSDYIYLLARTDPASERHDGLSELIVPLRSEGVTISPIHDMSGAHHFNEVFLDEVFVAEDALIGTEG